MRFRFSIRTLFVIAAVAGVFSLLTKFWMNHWTADAIVEELKDARATPYVYDDWNDEIWLGDEFSRDQIEGDNACVGLRLELVESTRTLKAISKVKSATEVTIIEQSKDAKVRGIDFEHLEALHVSNVDNGQICDWVRAAGKLRDLSLRPSEPLSAQTCLAIGTLRRLKVLRFSRTKLTRDHIDQLQSCRNISHLMFYDCEFDSGSLRSLNQYLTLESLSLNGTSASEFTLRDVKGLKNISSLDLSDSSIVDADLEILLQMPQLRDLSLYGCEKITEACVPTLIKMQYLESLDVLGSSIEKNRKLKKELRVFYPEWIM